MPEKFIEISGDAAFVEIIEEIQNEYNDKVKSANLHYDFSELEFNYQAIKKSLAQTIS
ncbi:MAG: hypothetical protein H0W64_09295 [Gammaproteobacteria bacterium]|nr:hypothetical protein [Gammaproteobacteria bacterium]